MEINLEAKKILILSKHDERATSDTAKSMLAELKPSRHNIEYYSCILEDINFVFDGKNLSVIDQKNKLQLDEYNAVFLMGWFKHSYHQEIALSVAHYLKSKDVKFLNSEAYFNRSRSKLSQYVIAALNDIPSVPFIASRHVSEIKRFMQRSQITYPVIVKSASAARGDHNYLAKNDQELEEALASIPENRLVLTQKYIENDGDYRLLVMNGEVKLVMHRLSQEGSHLNNTSKGGSSQLVDINSLDPQLIKDSIKTSKLLHREVTGVDMILDRNTGQYFFLETNNMPQLSKGSLVPQKIQALDDFFNSWIE